MAKGVYKIEKYKAELINDEWVAIGDPIEVIDNIENRMTADYASGLYDGDYWVHSTQAIVTISEAIFVGAHGANVSQTAYWIDGSYGGSPAAYTPSAGMVDAFYDIVSTIGPPSPATRQIRTLALTSTAANRITSIVSLASPCLQGADEILQITYRITHDITALQSNSQTSATVAEDLFSKTHFANSSIDGTSNWDMGGTNDPYILSWDNTLWGLGLTKYVHGVLMDDNEIVWTQLDNTTTDWAQGFTRRMSVDSRFGLSDSPTGEGRHCGMPIKGMGVGEDALRHISSVQKGSTSSIQNTFGRSVDGSEARPAYLDNTYIASSAAVVTTSDRGDWVDYLEDSYTMPYLYRITIETGGITGTATYKLRRRPLCMWYANSVRWEPTGIVIPTINWTASNTSVYSDDGVSLRHGQRNWGGFFGNTSNSRNTAVNASIYEAGFILQRYMYPDALFFDYTGITIHGINCQYANIDTNSTPALSVTSLLQCATDGSTIYAACEDTGLYRIERQTADYTVGNYAISTLVPPGITDATSCRGVTSGYAFQEGIITKIRVVFGGTNYAVDDTVLVAGANGAAATAHVATVDADGAITSVAVTAAGSGYIQDNVQAYISTGNGVGAKIIPEVGINELWALFDDATDAALYLAHMTYVTTDATNLAFDSTGPETITRTGGASDFLAEGFRVGQKLIIRTAEDAGNTGIFTIAAVTTTVITVSENLFTNATDTQAQIFGEKWEIMTETITDDSSDLTFADANPDTIFRNAGTSFLLQGFREGMEIVVSAATVGANDGVYTIADVTADTITIDSEQTLSASTNDVTAVMSTLTDFTLTNYTSGTPGRTGIIGLLWDREHADDRFVMLTPSAKTVNDGQTADASAGFSWWAHGISTGTTTAGTTDYIQTTNSAYNSAARVEHLATQCIVPMNNDNLWITMGNDGKEAASIAYGSTSNTDNTTNGYVANGRAANVCMKDKTMDTVIPGNASTPITSSVVFRKNALQFSDGTAWEGVLQYQSVDRPSAYSPSYHNQGGPVHSWGNGIFMNAMNGSTSAPVGAFIYSMNGDGTLAGANGEEQLPYGFWDEFGWDGTNWVLGNASARTTHAQVTFSGNNIDVNHTTGVLVGAGFASTDWAGDGFAAGDHITVALMDDTGNNGTFVIESLSGTSLTIAPYSNTLTSTDATNASATAVGDKAFIDGLALSFDTVGGVGNELVVGEYYDSQVYDGILSDNATSASWDTIWYEGGNEAGTTISDATHMGVTGSTVTTAPSAVAGQITAEPFAFNNAMTFFSNNALTFWVEPGMITTIEGSMTNLPYGEQNFGTGDFAFRFKCSGSHSTVRASIGLLLWTTAVASVPRDGISMANNIRLAYDLVNNPTLDQYTIDVRDTHNGTLLLAYNADRIVTIAAQDETDFDGVSTNGTWIGGDGAGGTAHAALDVITLDDGTTVTIPDAAGAEIDGNGDVLLFDITTKSTATRGVGEAGIGVNDYTTLDLDSGTDTITRTGGTDFVADGFLVGMKIVIYSATESANNGAYTITSVTTTEIGVAESITTTNAVDAAAQINSALVQTASTGSGTLFALILGTANEASADIGGDEFSIHRVGTSAGNLRYSLNGVEYYRSTGIHSGEYTGCMDYYDGAAGATLYDMETDYISTKRLRSIGNGTTTGAHNPNFMCVPWYIAGKDLQVQIAGVDATINTNPNVTPAAGEVTLNPRSGRLEFNSADDAKTVTLTWHTTHVINLQ